MLRFTIFGIPTKVHWLFWVVMALLGGITRSGMTPLGYQAVFIFMGVGFFSIMGHELGHALMARKYGARPEIMLYGLGGLASYPNTGRITREQRLQIIAAGPAFGFAVAALTWVAGRVIYPNFEAGFHLRVLLVYLWVVNFWWSIMNILPILPLDGGQFLGTWMHGRNAKLRGQIGAGVAAAVAVYGLVNHHPFLAIMFGLMAYQNFQAADGKPVKFF